MAGRSVGNIEITVSADTGKLKAQLKAAGTEAGKAAKQAIESELRGIEATVGVGVDSTELNEAVTRIEERLSGIEAEVGVAVSTSSLEAAEARIEHGLDSIDANVNVDIDDASKAAADAKLRANFAETGRQAGGDFGGEFGGALVAGVGALASPIAVALEGLVSAATAVVSSAFSGLAGGAGALTPILAGVGGEIAAIVVGSQGMVDALGAITDEFSDAVVEGRDFNLMADDVQDALRPLGPAARDFAEAFAEILPALSEVREAVSERLFAGLDDVLRDLSRTVIPSVTDALGIAADTANTFFRDLATAAEGVDFGGIMRALQPALDAMGDALITVLETIEPFLVAAAPAATALADGFARGAESLQAMVESGLESGALSRFLSEGVESLGLWWDLIRNVGDALFTIFQTGKDTGDAFITTLADIVGRWDDWLEGDMGRQKLEEFFALGEQVMRDLVPILEGLQGMFKNLVTPEAVDRFGRLADALGDFLPAFGELLDQIGRTEAFTHILNGLTAVLEPLAGLLGALPGPLIQVAGTLATLALVARTKLGGGLFEGLANGVNRFTASMETGGVGAFATVIGVTLLGAIADYNAGVEEARRKTEDLTNEFAEADTPMEGLTNHLTNLVNKTPELALFFDEAKVSVADVAAAALAGGDAWETMQAKLAHAFPDQAIPTEAVNTWLDLIGELPSRAVTAEAAADALNRVVGDGAGATEDAAGAYDSLTTALDLTDPSLRLVDASMVGVTAAAVGLSSPVLEAVSAFDEVQAAADRARDAADLLKQSWDNLHGGAMELSEANDAFAETLNKLGARQEEQAEQLEARRSAQEAYATAVDAAAQAEQDLADARADEDTDPSEIERLTDARDRANASVRDSKAALNEANAALNENLFAIRGNTEAALENRETIRRGVDEAIAIAAAKVREGASWEQARRSVLANKEALLDQMEQQGFSRQAAERYIETLELTPRNIRTAIELANQEAAQQGLRDYEFTIKRIDGKGVTTPVMVSGLQAVMAGLDGIKGTADDITRKTAKLAVKTEGVPQSKADLQGVIDKANELDGKTSTVTVNVRRTAEGGFDFGGGQVAMQHGGLSRHGALNVAGEAGLEFLRMGALRGLVTRPTLLPGGVHVTSTTRSDIIVRQLLAALTGVGGGAPGKQFNVVNNITPTQADPEMVAVSVVNRMAVLAGR